MHHEPIIRLNNVGLKYPLKVPIDGQKTYWALKNVSLELKRGETLGILGANGAGKSTLMKLLAGIICHDRGEIWIKKGLRVMLLAIGMGFESSLTGRENAIMGGLLLGLHRHTIEKRLDRIKDFSELGDFFEQPIYAYSAGMLARLGFSVAMEVNPDVLLLDEVMGVGDMNFFEKSQAALIQKIKSDMSVIIISHDAKTIRQMCSRAGWINKGETQSWGDVNEIVDQYQSFMHKQNH